MSNEELWVNLEAVKFNVENRRRELKGGLLLSRLARETGEKKPLKILEKILEWKMVFDAYGEIGSFYHTYGMVVLQKIRRPLASSFTGHCCHVCGRMYKGKRWRKYFSHRHKYELCNRCAKEWYERGNYKRRVTEDGKSEPLTSNESLQHSLTELSRTLLGQLRGDGTVHQSSGHAPIDDTKSRVRGRPRGKGVRGNRVREVPVSGHPAS